MSAEFARHAGYILASYAVAVVILGAMAAQTVLAYRSARARLGAAGEDNG